MRKLYQAIVNHPRSIITTFILAAVISLFCQSMVEVNYDIKDYLPEESPSTVALDKMEEEFEGGIPNARVMIRDVTVAEALEYKEQLSECTGVIEVMWLDDAANVEQPLETIDEEVAETYYKDGNALFTVTVDENEILDAVDAMDAVVGDRGAMSGDAVSTAVATTSTVSEIYKIAAFAVVFVFFMLFLTTTSWAEPVIVMAGLGIAIAINAGTNLIFGEISFVTNAAGNILQLAVSLDYSVFLIHRFEECMRTTADPKEAMVDALCKSTSSILSSGLTTVIGFLALVFMQFRIGPDLGLALAKGVSFSLITVFVFMPVLILTMNGWMHKTHHRRLLPDFHRFGRGVRKVMIPMVAVFVVLIVPAYLASNSNTYYYGSSYIFGEDMELGQDRAEIEKTFGKNDTYALMVPAGDTEREQRLSDALHEIPEVTDIISYVDTVGAQIPEEYLDADTVARLISDDYSRMVITVDADAEGEAAFKLIENVRDTVEEYYPGEWYLAGAGVSTYDLMDTITADMVKVNLIAIAAVFVVLLLTMKSISLPVILVLAIETAVWINLSIPYFRDSTVFYISYLIISSIQLGATVDYAILTTERYMEFRQTMGKKDTITETIAAVTTSVLTSGSVLAVVGYLLGAISSHGILSQLGTFLGNGSLLSLTIVLFVLPGLLYLCDGLIQKTTLHTEFYKENGKKQKKGSITCRPQEVEN